MNSNPNNEENIESRRLKHDAGNGNDGSSNEILQKENLIDPGNEHHHSTEEDTKTSDKKVDRSPRHEADAGGDASGSVGPAPKEGK